MTSASLSAAVALCVPALTATILCKRRLNTLFDRSVLPIAGFLAYQVLVLVPVQVIAALQIVGAIRKVSTGELAIVELGLLAAALLVLRRPQLQAPPRTPWAFRRWPLGLVACFAMLGGALAIIWLNLLTSYPWGWDALMYHLPVSVLWLQQSSLALPPSHQFMLSMPGNNEIFGMLLLGTGWQALSSTYNFFCLLFLGFAVYVIAHKCSADRIASALAAGIALSIPLFYFQGFSNNVDLAGAANIVAAIALFLSRRQQPDGETLDGETLDWEPIAAAALAIGISMGTKTVFYAYAFIFLAAAFVTLWVERRGVWKSFVRPAALLLAGSALPSFFWLWRAWLATGNPFYPVQVTVLGHKLDGLPPAVITPTSLAERMFTTVHGAVTYPWTERIVFHGALQTPYSVDCGVGGVFTTFVPLGIAFCVYACLRRRANRPTIVLLLLAAATLLVWWFAMEHYVRYGLPLWAVCCALTALLLSHLRQKSALAFQTLAVVAFAATCMMLSFAPLHTMLGRFKDGAWTRAANYAYPAYLDTLPAGSRILNRATTFNFIIAGNRLSYRVVPTFEAPDAPDAEFLRRNKVDYIVESSGESFPLRDFSGQGATLIYDRPLHLGEEARAVEWRIWKVNPTAGQVSALRPHAP